MEIGERYLALALDLGAVAPELVDSYTGPAALREGVAVRSADELARRVDSLRAVIDGAEARRRVWLRGQLDALAIVARRLGGERFGYRDLVERCHGVEARLVPEDVFAAAHARLDEALPGGGPLRERYRAWLERQRVPPERVLTALGALADELRERTRAAFGLPEDERVEFALVSDVRYAGSATHVDGRRTRVLINADLPLWSGRLLELAAHEAYPGHHTEHVHKATLGHAELRVFLYPTPQALISEGIALNGPAALLGDEAERVAAERLRPLKIAFDAETAAVARHVREALLPVRTNLAIRLDEGTLTSEQAHAYARRWLLESDEHVARVVTGLQARSWQPYESCYPEGVALCRAFIEREPDGFARLLHEQLTTTDLLGSATPRR